MLKILTDRANMLANARAFFKTRSVLEVDCCALRPYAPIDANIDVISATVTSKTTGFLHTSPEYAMKRLLSLGSGDIYYLGHVFRQGDIGRLHNPEFTMAEWYRIGFSFDDMIQETCQFIELFLGKLPIQKIGYREAFAKYVEIDYKTASIQDCAVAAAKLGLLVDAALWNKSTWIHFLLSHAIEPYLGKDCLTALIDYPPHEAALACVVTKNGESVAERFEIYHQGIELANGYHELTDGKELRRRFEEENEIRGKVGKERYALDEEFLAALNSNFPNCCGVSVGVDRALMLRNKASCLADVLPFAWK